MKPVDGSADLVLVRRDSQGIVEIVKKDKFDPTGYSFLKVRLTSDESDPMVMEEWVESDKLETYKNLEL